VFWLSDKTVKRFVEPCIILSVAKMVLIIIIIIQHLYSVMKSGDTEGLYTGVPCRENVRQENCIHSSHACCSLMSRK